MFDSPADLFHVLAGHRVELIIAMIGTGPLTIRELSRRVNRDVKGVHRDVHTLLDVHILERLESGFSLSYDAVRIDVLLT
ncbi:HVO_A0114 family putative DNA-binding protein [Paraburkholderia caledonica]|uniref:HVO_A0114 family putative DNA-binding protein n=1 Tax=Paraburkholderia caledonica TaxID=134536 RepID=UPI00211ABAC1|nr:DNA-binding protein [Paraburkholderia caledonica]